MPHFRFLSPYLSVAAFSFLLYQAVSLKAGSALNDELIESVKKADIAQVKLLLARGANVDARDSTTFRSCTSPNPPQTLYTPLILSMFGSANKLPHPALTKLLLENGADPNIQDSTGRTALSYAANRNDTQSIKLLLHHNAKVELADQQGRTPLMVTSISGKLEAAKLLLAYGANPNTKNERGETPLTRTTGEHNNDRVLQVLLDNGADPNFADGEGLTALHYATSYGQTKAMKILLQQGANPHAKDRHGITPIATIVQYGTKPRDKWRSTPAKIARRRAEMRKIFDSFQKRSKSRAAST
jgi:hypothetical protein